VAKRPRRPSAGPAAAAQGGRRPHTKQAAAAPAADARRHNTNAPPAGLGISEELAAAVFGQDAPEWQVDGDDLETLSFDSEEALKKHLQANEKVRGGQRRRDRGCGCRE
jgi:hypothetical protein